ncbi:MAG: beta-ketoacyl-[acyl-carrier-protein] synthase family protein [Chitinispirillaceae bacterium]|nr:beta-ketoacyl-[acyl-carrier-protein] synthase family protein [Chitinispirillaceae bacterium]
MNKKRVVISGLGMVTPIGTGTTTFWEAALKGTNGVHPLRNFDATDFRTKTGGEIRDFNPDNYLPADEQSLMGRSSQFAVAAAKMALDDAGFVTDDHDPSRIGISMGTTMGEPQILEQGIKMKYASGNAGSIPATLPRQYPCASIPANIARHFSITGPHIMIPTACAAGNYAIGFAYDMLQLGRIDFAIAGGSDPFSGIAFTGFNRLLATTSDLVRPFDKNRSGMAVSEGAGVLFIEELSSAVKRGAPIYAEILGYGLGCDAYKMTIPDPTGSGGIIALRHALENSGKTTDAIDYICAHGTGTGENDKTETVIVKEVFGSRAANICMSSIKSMLGHTMGAASAIEAAACALMLRHQVVLPTINYTEPDPDCDIDCVPNTARPMELSVIISNAYAFAGNTSTLVLGTLND